MSRQTTEPPDDRKPLKEAVSKAREKLEGLIRKSRQADTLVEEIRADIRRTK